MLLSLWNGRWGKDGHLDNPNWVDVEDGILLAYKNGSQFQISVLDGEYGQDILSLSVQDGVFLLDCYHNTSEDDDEVISLYNPNWETEGITGIFYKDDPTLGQVPMIEISGYYWDARSVTTDIELVKTIFKEFFETGKITHPWMQA